MTCVMIAGMPSPRKNDPPRTYGQGLVCAQITVDPAVWRQYKNMCRGEGTSASELLREHMRQDLRKMAGMHTPQRGRKVTT